MVWKLWKYLKNKYLDLENLKKEYLLNLVLCYRFFIFKKENEIFLKELFVVKLYFIKEF